MRILNWWLKRLFCVFGAEDIVTVKWIDEANGVGRLMIGKDVVPQAEAFNLVKELRLLQQLPSFRRVLESIKGSANEMMFMKSKVVEDIVFSKAMLYTVDVLEKLIANISRIEEIR